MVDCIECRHWVNSDTDRSMWRFPLIEACRDPCCVLVSSWEQVRVDGGKYESLHKFRFSARLADMKFLEKSPYRV